MKKSIISWDFIRENYPDALKEYMSTNWTLESFWQSYDCYLNCKIVEEENGAEVIEFKIASKIGIFFYLSSKTILVDDKLVSVYNVSDLMARRVNDMFKLIDDQIKNNNYLNN